jgi:hypothetical protein
MITLMPTTSHSHPPFLISHRRINILLRGVRAAGTRL